MIVLAPFDKDWECLFGDLTISDYNKVKILGSPFMTAMLCSK
jgi:hypothetical protein